MKILYILSSFNTGGVESVVRDLMNNMVETNPGLELFLIILSNNKLELLDQLNKRIKVHVLPTANSSRGMTNFWNNLRQYRNLRNLIREISPDVIHTHILLYSSIPVYMAMWGMGKTVRHFHTIHTIGLHYASKSLPSRLKCFIERFIYRHFKTRIICISPVINDVAKLRLGVDKSRIFNISNGIDLRKYFNQESSGHNNGDALKLVYLARLDKGKNHLTLLEAMRKIISYYPHTELHLLGDGPEMNTIKNYIEECGLAQNVVLYGNVQDVVPVLKKCDIGVFPSEFEGCSIAILEMMASGLPIVCSSIPAFTSIFGKDEVLFFDCKNSSQLSDQIIRLISDESLIKNYSEKAMNIANRFSLDSLVSKHIKAYTHG